MMKKTLILIEVGGPPVYRIKYVINSLDYHPGDCLNAWDVEKILKEQVFDVIIKERK